MREVPVVKQETTVWSDGTRLAADLFLPDEHRDGMRHPAVLLCHGWGGLKQHLSVAYAPLFVDAGFVALTFDYRGWGESDGKLLAMPDGPPLTESREVDVRARVIREVVDPFDQVQDIQSALDLLASEPSVDDRRIGIWGSSYGAGHAIVTAATDDRIRCVVAQVGAYLAPGGDDLPARARARAVDKARGRLEPRVPQGIDGFPGLRGTPDLAKMIRYRPRDLADRIGVPTLIIDAEREELMDIREHGRAVYEIVRRRAPARYLVYPCTHYEVYTDHHAEASAAARDWFVEHLKP